MVANAGIIHAGSLVESRRIIGASSISGKRGEEYLSAYCAFKFAVRGLMQSAGIVIIFVGFQ
ncbi:hypothetical protein DFH29DRAFT_946767 [Suillus ampliporus]|nr:hypothetical protein DFH29DRAFT_946767 [Suillus ampliporus]